MTRKSLRHAAALAALTGAISGCFGMFARKKEPPPPAPPKRGICDVEGITPFIADEADCKKRGGTLRPR